MSLCFFINFILSSGDYANALSYFEKGIANQPQVRMLHTLFAIIIIIICLSMPTIMQDVEHNESCNAGIARMAIRTGDVRR